MPTLAEIVGSNSLQTLTVHVPGQDPETCLLQHGITIGRAHYNTVVVDHYDLCREHAAVYLDHRALMLRVKTIRDGFALRLPSGNEINDLPLTDGVRFFIGEVSFQCGVVPIPVEAINESPVMSSQEPAPPPRYALPALRIACPRCHVSILHLASSAKFCPKCGLELPAHCPPWDGNGFDPSNPALIAYANALFNLGVRFENIPGGTDLEQALRYYTKAARVGISAAKARLESHKAATESPAEVISS